MRDVRRHPAPVVLLGAVRRDFWTGPTLLLAAGALVALLFSFGFALPFYRLLYSVEFLRRLRYPIKFYLLTTLCVALLAGFAVDAPRRRRRRTARSASSSASRSPVYAAAFFAAVAGRRARPRRAAATSRISPPAADALLPAIRRVFRGDALLGSAAVVLLAARPLRGAPERGRALRARSRARSSSLCLGPAALRLRGREGPRAAAGARSRPGGARARSTCRPAPELTVLETRTAHPELPPAVAKLARVQIEELIPATGRAFGVRYLFDDDPDGSYGCVNRIAGEVLTRRRRRSATASFGSTAAAGRSPRARSAPGFEPVTGFSRRGPRLVLHEAAAAAAELRWALRAHTGAPRSPARSSSCGPTSSVRRPTSCSRGPPTTRPSARRARPRSRVSALEAGPRGSVDVERRRAGHLVWSRTFFPAGRRPWTDRRRGSCSPTAGTSRSRSPRATPGRGLLEPGTFRFGVALQAVALLAAVAIAVASIRP